MLLKVSYQLYREKKNHSINPGKTPPLSYPLHTCQESEWKPSPRTHVDTYFTETLVVCQNQFLETSSNSTHMICVSRAIKPITLTSKSAAPVHYSNITLEETNSISNSVLGWGNCISMIMSWLIPLSRICWTSRTQNETATLGTSAAKAGNAKIARLWFTDLVVKSDKTSVSHWNHIPDIVKSYCIHITVILLASHRDQQWWDFTAKFFSLC